ncbi:MAG: homocysteine S-methyltransferase family protein, partial [Rhodobacteraceae bacterium]|nr:homocysteine S-methyltransferase family protein [Paracoccaceae bacterium]
YHSVQIQTLKDANADFTWASSFTNVNEAVGVTRAAAKIGMPVAISFTLSGQSRLASGLTLKQAIEEIDRQAGSTKPAFYGINCSHPIEIEAALEPGDWILRMRNMAPNASAQEKSALVDLEGIDDGDPADLGRRMGVLAGRYPHLDIWGGCCGTWDKHFDQIALNVRKARGVFRTL